MQARTVTNANPPAVDVEVDEDPAPVVDICSAPVTPETSTRPNNVYFGPNGGYTFAAVSEIDTARVSVDVQTYSFTSAPIAKALVDAHKRGGEGAGRSR